MSRPLEEQLRALAHRNLSGVDIQDATAVGDYATQPEVLARGRRSIVFAVAAMVLVVGGIAAVVLTRDDASIPVTSGAGSYLVPPLDATDISGIQVPGGSTINFTVDGQPYQLTQLDFAGEQPSEEYLELRAAGAEAIEVDGIGSVYVHCGHEPTIDDEPGPQGNAAATAVWLEGSLSVDLLVRGDDTGRLCAAPDIGSSPLVETIGALGRVDDPGWRAFVAANGIEDVSISAEPARSCLSAGEGEVCAERDGTVLLTASGLEPGSTFTYEVQLAGQLDSTTNELVVAADGNLPGALGVMSVIPLPVTITVSATSADGQPISGPLSVQ
ncbi:hypothetical protein [Rhabdothermincola salaria]|uniref:hypothetical protein n=1 Tax=Rhabdothermincola salaria TaxID=2903142 RepID=UPI001E39F094|nr:hypothetical protein [Rhabdothermincola salaria]MCD9625006.1 hypothetical protein [Rhabdothermincola salaria]